MEPTSRRARARAARHGHSRDRGGMFAGRLALLGRGNCKRHPRFRQPPGCILEGHAGFHGSAPLGTAPSRKRAVVATNFETAAEAIWILDTGCNDHVREREAVRDAGLQC